MVHPWRGKELNRFWWSQQMDYPFGEKFYNYLDKIDIPIKGLKSNGDTMLARELMPEMHPWAFPLWWRVFNFQRLNQQNNSKFTLTFLVYWPAHLVQLVLMQCWISGQAIDLCECHGPFSWANPILWRKQGKLTIGLTITVKIESALEA